MKALIEYLRIGGLAAMLAIGGLAVSACDEGGFEEAGEEIDDAVDDAEDEL